MNAYIQIIARLIEAVPPAVWKGQPFFPFFQLSYPVGSLFDCCLFSQSAAGALGIMWVRFEGQAELLTLPFRLARYSESGDLISLSPWSLRDASFEADFYDSMRAAMHKKNPMVSSQGGLFRYRYAQGEPSTVALGLKADSLSTSVRVESQETFKIYRTFSLRSPKPKEVEVLEYLSGQNKFTQFPRLISVYEFKSSPQDELWAVSAFSTQYIQHQGTLWHAFLNDLQQCRFGHPMKSRSARLHRNRVLEACGNTARMLAEFHSVMLEARDSSQLAPLSARGSIRANWVNQLRQQASLACEELTSCLVKSASDLCHIVPLIMEKMSSLLESIDLMEDPGLLVCTHGNAHLGQILLGNQQFFLTDFSSHRDFHWTDSQGGGRQILDAKKLSSCIEDLVSLTLSIRYAWGMTHQEAPQQVHLSFSLLEEHCEKCYLNLIKEDPKSSELLPSKAFEIETLKKFFFILRVVDELILDCQTSSPRVKLSLEIMNESLFGDVQ